MKNKSLFAAALSVASIIACTPDGKSGAGQRVSALEDSAWECSEWISVVDAPVVESVINDGSRAADGANWFLATPVNEKRVKSAVWMATGLGVFDIYVNGKRIGDEILKPGFTHREKTKLSFTYDVTSLFNKGKGASNELSAQVTPGWWADKIVTPAGHKGMIGRKCAFRGVLKLTYADGTTELFGTDTLRWKAGIAGPVTHAAIFDGEDYDARIPEGFETPEKLSVPEVNREFAGIIVPSDGAEIYLRRDLALSPVKAYVWEGVENASEEAYGKVKVVREFSEGEPMTVSPGQTLVVDFGQNSAAVPEFVFSAVEGTVMTCLPSEILNDGNGAKSRGMDGPEGSTHRLNLRVPKEGMILTYTFAGGESPVGFLPERTFFGYRYVSVTATSELTIRNISSIPVSSITREMETGLLTTGNELVNKLISNTVWGQRSNYLSVTTDCPQRNERLGWTADTQVYAETGSFFANTDAFFHKWMRDMRDTQTELGGYPGVAPVAQYGATSNSMMRVGWADAGVIVPWTVWKQFGDTSIIDENWDSMTRFMTHVAETKYDHTALAAENGNFQWADWLSYEALESCSRKGIAVLPDGRRGDPFPETVVYWNYLSASYWLIDAQMMRDMAAATGRDASVYEAMIAEARSYIINNFLTEEGTFREAVLNTMQTPALFALRNEIVEGEAREAMCSRLRENFTGHGDCLQTGFLGTAILMQTLTDNGMTDIAYNLLFQRKNPSWLYSVDNGATTIWERWNSYTYEEGMGPKGMNSFNHYAYGAVCAWIWEVAAGIAADSAEPGFKHIIMKPVPDRRLGSIDAEYASAAGVIRSSWKYEGDKCVWTFTIPEGAYATVTVPGSDKAEEYQAGTFTLTL